MTDIGNSDTSLDSSQAASRRLEEKRNHIAPDEDADNLARGEE
jgi:hypothetical protein